MPKLNEAFRKPRLMVLGATGSVGRQLFALLCQSHAGAFEVAGCFAQKRWAPLRLWKEHVQAKAFGVVEPCPDAEGLVPLVQGWPAIQSLCASTPWEILVVACSGIEVLPLVIWALQHHKEIWFANKEVWVSAGSLLRRIAQTSRSSIRPLDSEHQALFHLMRPYGVHHLPCWPSCAHYGIARLHLLASGGPFWGWSPEQLHGVTPEMAVHHPVWSMGPKISVDSATWMNKALEVIEACRLFSITPRDLQVVRYPEGWLHGAIEDHEGRQSCLYYPPHMAYGLSAALWEARKAAGDSSAPKAPLAPLWPWERRQNLTFEKIEISSIPALQLACQAYDQGGDGAPCVMNAANEVAVARFLRRELGFTQIVKCVQVACDRPYGEPQSCEEVLALHQEVIAAMP